MPKDNQFNKRIGRGVSQLSKRIGYSFAVPNDVQISTTSRCNISCKMCPRQTLGYSQQHLPDMDFQQFMTIVDKLPVGIEKIFLHGLDEPLLNQDIPAMIAYAAKKYAVYLWTNGLLLSKGLAEAILNASVSGITFSIDSPRKDQYENIRQGARFDNLINNLMNVSRVRNESYPKVVLSVNMTVMEENYHQIAEMMIFCASAGIEQLNVLCVHTSGRGGLVSLLPEFKTEISVNRRLAQQIGIKLQLWNIKEESSTTFKLCDKPWTSMFVRSDGVVEPCCIHESRPEYRVAIANLFTDSFWTAWNGTKVRAFRRALSSNHKPDMCINCDLLFQ